MTEDLLSPEEKLARARNLIRKKAPYFETAVTFLATRFVPGLGTLGVTSKNVLLVDPNYTNQITTAQLAGVLVHEVSHVLRKHCDRTEGMVRFKASSMRGQDLTEAQRAAVTKANICEDLAINPDVRDMGFELPTGKLAGVFPANYDLPERLTAEEYYRLFDEAVKKKKKAKQKELGPSSGQCGSCAGNRGEYEPEDGAAINRSEATLEQVRRTTAAAMKEHAKKGIGKVPAGWLLWAGEIDQPPKIPWSKVLARQVRQGVERAEGAVDLTWNGASRRQAAIGYGPGKPILPRYYSPLPNIEVVVDTSGSMSGSLTEGLCEIAGVLKTIGAPVSFVAIDAAIQAEQRVNQIQDILPLLKGGGGTDFARYFDRLKRRKGTPSCIVFFSDGFAHGVPQDNPVPETSFIWLLTKHGERPCSWGKEIRVE